MGCRPRLLAQHNPTPALFHPAPNAVAVLESNQHRGSEGSYLGEALQIQLVGRQHCCTAWLMDLWWACGGNNNAPHTDPATPQRAQLQPRGCQPTARGVNATPAPPPIPRPTPLQEALGLFNDAPLLAFAGLASRSDINATLVVGKARRASESLGTGCLMLTRLSSSLASQRAQGVPCTAGRFPQVEASRSH